MLKRHDVTLRVVDYEHESNRLRIKIKAKNALPLRRSKFANRSCQTELDGVLGGKPLLVISEVRPLHVTYFKMLPQNSLNPGIVNLHGIRQRC